MNEREKERKREEERKEGKEEERRKPRSVCLCTIALGSHSNLIFYMAALQVDKSWILPTYSLGTPAL